MVKFLRSQYWRHLGVKREWRWRRFCAPDFGVAIVTDAKAQRPNNFHTLTSLTCLFWLIFSTVNVNDRICCFSYKMFKYLIKKRIVWVMSRSCMLMITFVGLYLIWAVSFTIEVSWQQQHRGNVHLPAQRTGVISTFLWAFSLDSSLLKHQKWIFHWVINWCGQWVPFLWFFLASMWDCCLTTRSVQILSVKVRKTVSIYETEQTTRHFF